MHASNSISQASEPTGGCIVRRCIKGMRELVNIACGFERATPSKWYRAACSSNELWTPLCGLGLSMLCSGDVRETSLFER